MWYKRVKQQVDPNARVGGDIHNSSAKDKHMSSPSVAAPDRRLLPSAPIECSLSAGFAVMSIIVRQTIFDLAEVRLVLGETMQNALPSPATVTC
jgi:hypothetical protein